MDLPSYETLKTEIAAPHVLLVTLNRPQAANAFNTQMGREFPRPVDAPRRKMRASCAASC